MKNLVSRKLSNDNKYKLLDLFAGAGGLSNGFVQTGKFEVVGVVEINQAALETYIRNHGNDKDIIIKSNENGISDITKINFAEFKSRKRLDEDHLVVIGGPPCQGFSNANRQKSCLISGNNQLVKEFVRAIDELRPVAFLMENVNTISSSVHKFFVTEHVEKTKFAYSSMKHLREICKFTGYNIENLIKNETIVIGESKKKELGIVFDQVIKKGKIQPIIYPGSLYSRLKSIVRKMKKSDAIVLKDREKKEINMLIDFLGKQYKNYNIKEILEIIKNTINLLRNIIFSSEANCHYIDQIQEFVDLNQFLLNYNEIYNEKIVLVDKPYLFQSKTKIKVLGNVFSYNVVEYLKIVFSYYGYEIDCGVLTATDFGVPQRRNRFIVLGVKKEKVKADVVKLPKAIFLKPFTTKDAIEDLENLPPQQSINDYIPKKYIENNQITPLLKYYRKGNEEGYIFNHINTKSTELSLKRFQHIKINNGKNFHNLSDELKKTYTDASRTQNTIYLRLNYNEPAPTVVNVRKSMWNHPINSVAISIREAARLQSFRDNFIFYGSKDQQYQQIGNAVPPLMARAIAEKLLQYLGDKPVISIIEEFDLI